MDQAARLRRLAAQRKSPILKAPKRTRVITITSGKGGVGKTNFVVNLAIALSMHGKRVYILDADLGLANADVVLGMVPKHTLHDVVQKKKTLAEIAVTGPAGITLLPGGSGLTELADLPDAEREALIEELLQLEGLADILLIDTGAGLSRTVLSFVEAADEMFVVTTPEPTAIRDAYGVIKVAVQKHSQKKISVIVNMARDAREGSETAERLLTVSRRFLQIDLQFLGAIRADLQVVEAVKQQQPFVILFPRSRAAENVQEIAAALLELPQEKQRGLAKFFNRLARLWENGSRSLV
ncbi:MAG: MinD/ParA family protein [Firmicutes bacterium]|nr:MinD/ParA family protein [Bacillota bacterium]